MSRDEGDLPTVPETDALVPPARPAVAPPVPEAEARLLATMVRKSFTVSAWALAVIPFLLFAGVMSQYQG